MLHSDKGMKYRRKKSIVRVLTFSIQVLLYAEGETLENYILQREGSPRYAIFGHLTYLSVVEALYNSIASLREQVEVLEGQI